jgi:hypothetical protein
MARELDMNPDKFEKLANHRQEPWKAPLADYIEQLYFKRFGKRQPDNIRASSRSCPISAKRKPRNVSNASMKSPETTRLNRLSIASSRSAERDCVFDDP